MIESGCDIEYDGGSKGLVDLIRVKEVSTKGKKKIKQDINRD